MTERERAEAILDAAGLRTAIDNTLNETALYSRRIERQRCAQVVESFAKGSGKFRESIESIARYLRELDDP